MQKASEHTLLDLCVLHMHDIQLQQLYIRYWSWNYTDVSDFHPASTLLPAKCRKILKETAKNCKQVCNWGPTFGMPVQLLFLRNQPAAMT